MSSQAVSAPSLPPGLRDLRRGASPEAPELTVLFLHHAGGSAAGWAPFAEHLPSRWRLLGLDLPARVTAPARTACRSTAEAVERLLPAVAGELSVPYAVFGHSMGALVAYELVRALERRGSTPVWLGVSGMPAPRLVGGGERRDRWEPERLVQFMRELGGIPESAFRLPALVDRMVRTLRGDLAIVDGYRYTDGPPLRTAVSVFSGDADPVADAELVRPWAEQARSEVAFHTWPGGHFYLFDRIAEVCDRIVLDITRATAA